MGAVSEPGSVGRGIAPVPTDASFLWAVLTSSAGVSVMLVDRAGTIHQANEAAARLFADRPSSEFVGMNFSDLFGEEFLRPRLHVIGRVLDEGIPIQVRSIYKGRGTLATHWPTPRVEGAEPSVLVVHQLVGMAKPIGTIEGLVLKIQEGDLGHLSSLNKTELRVLAHITEGLTTAEIAKRMFRSTKTIEWYRSCLGEKLGVGNRVELARLGIEAGLTAEMFEEQDKAELAKRNGKT